MNLRGTVTAMALAGACAVGGCSSNTTPSPGPKVPGPSATSAAPNATPDALVGMWRVTGAGGEPANTVLRIASDDASGLTLFRDCGEFNGVWKASTSGAFLGSISDWSDACMTTVGGSDATPAWLAAARAYRVQGAERYLLAANGSVLATLLPGGRPPAAPNPTAMLRRPPTLDPATVRKLRTPPAPLPAGSTAATATTILGTWSPNPKQQSTTGTDPFLEFDADGKWRTSDGCNDGGGRWVLGSGGELLTTALPTAGVGCAGPVTDIPVTDARRAAVTGDVLTLYSANGKLLGRLTR